MNEQRHQGQKRSCVGEGAPADFCQCIRAIIEGTCDAMFIKDRDGRYRLCNASTAQFIGKRSEDIIGQDDYALFPVRAAESIREQDRLVMVGAKVVTFEETLAMPGGELRTFLSTKGPLFDSERQVCGLFGISRDITERKRVEEALREANTAVELAMEGISKLDRAGRYLFVNAPYAALLGYRPEELVGQSWEITVHPEDRSAVGAAFSRMLAVGKAEGEFRGIRKDGTVFDQYVVIVKPQSEAKALSGHYCFAKDVTERKLTERREQATQRLLASITRVQSLFIDNEKPDAVFDIMLRELLQLTESEYGWIGEVRPDEDQPVLRTSEVTNIAWNNETRTFLAHQAPMLEFRHLKTLFGHIMTSGQPVIANDPAHDPRVGGMLPGYRPMHAILSLPFSHGGVMTGMVCIANRPGGYDEALVAYLQPFLGTCGQVVEGLRSKRLRSEAEQALRMSEDRFRVAMQGTNDGIWDWDLRTDKVYFSERWKTMLGYEDHEIADLYSEWESRLHPGDQPRALAELHHYLQTQVGAYDVEFRFRKKDGTYCWIQARGKALWDAEGHPTRMAGSHTEITERKWEEALQNAERQTLELVAKGRPLNDVLEFLCRAVEAQTAPMLCAVMLASKEGTQLLSAAAPSLPDVYNRLVRVVPIGPMIGSCGSAAHFRKPVFVADIATDLLWKDYAQLALPHGLKACWSQPILSSTGILFGTFAAYFREQRAPQQKDLRLIERASHIAALAIEHARTLEALKESERRFHAFMQHSPAVTFIKDRDGRHLFVNAWFEQLFGMSSEEAVAKTVFDFLPNDTAARVHGGDQRVMASGQPMELEETIPTVGGRPKHWLTIKFPLETEQGRLLGGIGIDITERKRLERASQDQHDRLRLAMDIAKLATWDWNILTNQVIWSENCEEVKGLPRGSFDGTFEAYQRLVYPEDLPGLHADIEQALSGQKPYHTEHRIVPPTGEMQWLEGNGVVYRDELGRPIRMVGTVRNITEQKRVEQTLRVNEERYARATAVGQVGVWELDVRAGTYYGDRNLKAMFGYHLDELSADPYAWLNVVHPDDQSIAMTHWQRIARGEVDDYQYELRMVRKDGTVIWTDVRGHAVRDPAGQVTHLIGATVDISDRKRMEDALRASEERHRSVVAAMAEGVVILDGRGIIRSCNASACRILGLTEEQVLGCTSLDPQWRAIHEDGSPFPGDTHPVMKTLRTGRASENVVMGVHRPDGSIVWLSINTQPITSGLEQPLLGVVASFRDITRQRQREADLKLFRTLLDQVTDSIEVIDPSSGRFLDGNRQSHESLGYTREELSNLTVPDIDPLVTSPVFHEYMQHLRETDVPLRVESVHLRKDGTTFPVEVVAQIIRHQNEYYVVAVVRDITERKRSEAALRDSEERLRTLYDDNPSMYFTVAPDGTILSVNRFGAQQLGYHSDELIGGRVFDIVYEEDTAFVLQELAQAFAGATGSIESLEFRKRTKEGTIIWVRERLRIVRTEEAGSVALIVSEDISARKKIEAVLAEREEHLRLFIEHSPVALAMFDQEMRYLAVSQRWREDYQLGDQPLLGRSHYEVFPEVPERWKAIHRRCLAGAVESCKEDPFGRLDGRTNWSHWEIRPWLRSEGTVGGIVIFSEDITARKQAEIAAYESEERFTLAVRATNDGIWDWNILTGEQHWSGRHFELFGLQSSEVVSTYASWRALVHPDDVDRVGQAMCHHLGMCEPYDVEVRVKINNGGYRWFRDRGQAVWDASGRPIRMVGSISDITEQRNAEQALRVAHAELEQRVAERTEQLALTNRSLQKEIVERTKAEEAIRESELRYKLLTEATFDGIAIHDQGVLLEVNPGLERMFGYQPGELLGRSILDLIAEESLDRVAANMRDGVRGPYEAIACRKDGTTFPGEVVVRPYHYRGKEVRLVAGRDITERKHLEVERLRRTEELECQIAERTAEIAKLESQRAQAEKLAAMGRLAAGVAHEINNPIAGIKNAFTLVRQAIDPTHPSAEFVGLIDREIARVASIIQNMYQLCRPETRSGEMVDVRILVTDLEALLTPLLQQRRLKFVVDLMSAPRWLCVPRGDLMQVMLNLLTNAIECSPEGSPITLSLREEADGVRLVVRDQGGGIAPEYLPHIFDPFYTTKTGRDQKGMGLGLSVSQSLVQAMGGTIEVDTQVHCGSTFTMCLPRDRVGAKV
ncbi:PAS domain S-box protein [Nitrospira sp. CMX1]